MIEKQADIMLVICPPWGVVNPPLGPAYLASNLEQKSLAVRVCDVNAHLFHSVAEDEKSLWQIKNDNTWRKETTISELFHKWNDTINIQIKEIINSETTVVGFTVIDPNEFFTCKFIKRLKRLNPGIVIITGGPGCEAQGQREFLRKNSGHCIDYFVVGEGELVLTDFLITLKNDGDLAAIPQVIDAKGSLELNSSIPRLDLDSIVTPTFNEFEMNDYSQESLAVIWSRGCIGRCLYCKEKAIWGKYRTRSVQSILTELKYYNLRFNATNFVVYDSAVNGNPKHLEKICEAILSSSLTISWSGEAIALKSLSDHLLEMMKKAGCHTLVYGVESGSDRVLESMGKISNSIDAGNVIRRTHRAGIKVAVNILVGFPGETDEDFQMTIDFLKKHAKFIDRLDSVSTLQIVSDTPLATKTSDFDVVLPTFEPHDKWYIKDQSNTYEIRQKRLENMLAVARYEGFEIGRTFLNENQSIPATDNNLTSWNISCFLKKLKTKIGIMGR